MTIRSLNALRVFDAVASGLSFSGAAHRLTMSQGAISYRIKQLEAELGLDLFSRAGSSIKLTEAGLDFHVAIRRALTQIDDAARHLRRRASREVVIGCSTYFGSRWLSSRLIRFLTKHPKVSLRLQPTFGDSALTTQDVDVAVVWGSIERFGAQYPLLLESTVTPMAGPRLAKNFLAASTRDGLRGVPLIHDDETRDAWRGWLKAAGLSDRESKPGPIIPDANMRVQAVIDEQGVALFDQLVSEELVRGRLIAPSDVRLGGYGYFMVISNARGELVEVAELLQWLTEEASM